MLRPGGIELTRRLVRHADPKAADRIVEFGPGLGATAEMLLAVGPREYTGVDPNPEGAEQLLAILRRSPHARLVTATASRTGLADGCADLVVGEAMLTMQSEKDKQNIIAEAFRILAPGGRYAIHELGLRPDDVPEQVETEISKALSRTIKVGARPLTAAHWARLLEEAGFTVEHPDHNPMHLLEPARIVRDEGLRGALRYFDNVRRNPAARKRLLAMRKVFRAHRDHINAVAFVARKPG